MKLEIPDGYYLDACEKLRAIVRAMLARAGIDFTEHPFEKGRVSRAGVTNIEIEDGYDRFVSVLLFDEDGALVRVAAWE